jgi:ATP-dependent DNA ligase
LWLQQKHCAVVRSLCSKGDITIEVGAIVLINPACRCVSVPAPGLGIIEPCLIDGEAIVCDENGLALFDLIRRHDAGESAVLSAFDLLELDGKDLRRKPIETRKPLLAELLKGSHLSLVFNECFEEDGPIVFREACRLCYEGIVSKRLGSIYRRGRSLLWLKVKNPNAPAVKREAEEDWGR